MRVDGQWTGADSDWNFQRVYILQCWYWLQNLEDRGHDPIGAVDPSQGRVDLVFAKWGQRKGWEESYFETMAEEERTDNRLIGSNNGPSMTTPVLEESKTRSFEAVSGLSSFNVLLVKSSKFTDTRNKLPKLPLQSCPVRDQSKGSSSLSMECETGVVRGIKNLEASTDVAEKWCKARGFGLFQEG
ncbi:hypothetical protein PPACK8108_LOCUS1086 [Phakopsora pachyrhizi]|uniref:Uncharacterized protein n=1 Tax=Phakopsora pachyrhizi TaxID=170000 RepID=A0AAV0AFK6_PHAPC|nr:hypothetical protein PPACK8108_LOCUS1086 [Phakopsora pachyrhizi]